MATIVTRHLYPCLSKIDHIQLPARCGTKSACSLAIKTKEEALMARRSDGCALRRQLRELGK